MARGLTVCNQPGCPVLSPGAHCVEHQPKPWHGSTRRRNVGRSGSRQQRDAARIIRRDRGICHWCGKPGAEVVDHVICLAEGGTDTDDNKAPIHQRPCHQIKTAAEAARGRARGKA